MAKRLSSEFTFAPQLKKHIGEMDVDYVFDRQSVYDKTMNLLFQGANGPQVQINTKRRSLNHSMNCISLDAQIKNNLKQTIMNNNCQLETKTLLDRSTEICLVQSDKCSFCEKFGCFTALKRCAKCEDLFCNNCSFSVSLNDDGALCLSCFK